MINEKNSEIYIQKVKESLKLALKGDPEHQYKLGYFYLRQKGVAQDKLKAKEWFELSAQQDHSHASYYLGLCFKNGWGTEIDMDEAKHWFERAKSLGHQHSETILRKWD